MTLVGEKERKFLKDIIKQARNPVKSRVIPQGKVNKYLSQIYLSHKHGIHIMIRLIIYMSRNLMNL